MKTTPMALALAALLAFPIATDAKISKQLREEIASQLVPFAEETDSTAQQALLLTRAILEGRSAQKDLAAAQASEDKRTRIAAGLGLVLTGDKKATTFVSQELASDARLLETLEELVASLPDKTEANILSELWKGTTPDIKKTILRYAVRQTGPVYQIVKSQLTSKSPDDRKLAVEALVFHSKPTSIETLGSLAQSKDESARADAFKALVALSRHPELEVTARPHLEKGLKDKSPLIRAEVARRLLEVRHPDALLVAFEQMKEAKEPSDRIEWMQAILATGLRPKMENVKPLLDAEDAEVKALAHELGGATKDPEFLKTLIKMEQSTEFEPRLIALRSLGYTGSAEAVTIYSRTLFESLDNVRELTVKGLITLAREDSLGALERALKNEKNPAIRLSVIEAIGEIKSPKSVQALRFLVTDNNVQVKRGALESIRKIGLKEGGAALDVLLRDRNVEVQWLAFLTAVELSPERVAKGYDLAFRNPPSTYMDDIRAMKPAHRNMLIKHLLTKTTGSAQGDAIRYALMFGGFDGELREIALDSTGPSGDRRAIFLAFANSSDPLNRTVLERVVRASAGPKPLVHSAAWMLTRSADQGMEPTFRGFLGSSDPGIKALSLYGITKIHM